MPAWLAALHAHVVAMPFGVYLFTFVVCFVSGLVPAVNSEAYLLSVSALSPLRSVAPLSLAAATGQMTAKVLLYLSGRGVVRLPFRLSSLRIQRGMDAARAKLEAHAGGTSAVLFASAALGLPPFYIVSILAGGLNIALSRFLLLGLAGRTLRFGVVILLPQLLRLWL